MPATLLQLPTTNYITPRPTLDKDLFLSKADLHGTKVTVLTNGAADCNLIRQHTAKKLAVDVRTSEYNTVTVANGKGVPVLGEMDLRLNVNHQYWTNFVAQVIGGLAYDICFGTT